MFFLKEFSMAIQPSDLYARTAVSETLSPFLKKMDQDEESAKQEAQKSVTEFASNLSQRMPRVVRLLPATMAGFYSAGVGSFVGFLSSTAAYLHYLPGSIKVGIFTYIKVGTLGLGTIFGVCGAVGVYVILSLEKGEPDVDKMKDDAQVHSFRARLAQKIVSIEKELSSPSTHYSPEGMEQLRKVKTFFESKLDALQSSLFSNLDLSLKKE